MCAERRVYVNCVHVLTLIKQPLRQTQKSQRKQSSIQQPLIFLSV